MRTALLTGSYLEGNDPLGSDRLHRMRRWLAWHGSMFDDVYLSDNGSPEHLVAQLPGYAKVLRYQNHLSRMPQENGYVYCWRHLYTIKILIQLGYDKIVFLDSDCFIVSQNMLDHVKRVETGWEAFNLPKYSFPSAEFYVLCRDSFPIYEAFTSVPYPRHVGKLMETALPFTRINGGFKVDRWGETRVPQSPWMDCYCQCPTDHPLKFTY